MFQRWTDNARGVANAARRSCRRPWDEVGADGLLCALLQFQHGLARKLLRTAAVNPDVLRTELGASSDGDARQVLEQAVEEARRRGENYVGTQHLLLAIARQAGCRAGRLLAAHGATAERLESLLDAELAERRRTYPPLMRRLGAAYRIVLNRLRGRE